MRSSFVVIKFAKYQRSATASIRIANDDIVEKTESFQLRLTLPDSGIQQNLLKYGVRRYTTVYIKDSELHWCNGGLGYLVMCVCVYVLCASIYICTCTCYCTYGMHVYVCIHIYVCTYVYICVYIQLCTYVRKCMLTYQIFLLMSSLFVRNIIIIRIYAYIFKFTTEIRLSQIYTIACFICKIIM